MSRPSADRRVGLVLALFLVLSLGSAGCGGERTVALHSTRFDGRPRSKPVSKWHVAQVPRSLMANYSLFRRPPDGIPQRVWQAAHGSFRAMRWSQAHRLRTSSPDDYWLVPGGRIVCILAVTPGSSSIGAVCAPIRQALRHGVAYTSLDVSDRERNIVGVAPQGVRRVTIRSRQSSADVRVHQFGLFTLSDTGLEAPELFILHR